MTDKHVMSTADHEYKLQKIHGNIQLNSVDINRSTCRTHDFDITQRRGNLFP
jgi:hypothetical protein